MGTHEYDPEIIRWALKKARRDAGLSLREAGERAGVSESTVFRIETGDTEAPKFADVASLAHVYNLSLDTLAAEAGLPPTSTQDDPVPYQLSPRLRAVLRRLHSDFADDEREQIETSLYLLTASKIEG